jgi:hypothetical protein
LDHFALNRLGAAEDVESVVNTISCKWWGTKVSYSPMARPTLSRPIYIPKWRPYFIRTGIIYIRERESEILYKSSGTAVCAERVISLANRMIIIIHPEWWKDLAHPARRQWAEPGDSRNVNFSFLLSLLKKESKEQDRAESLT